MTDEFGEIEKLTEIEKLADGSSQNIIRLLELSHDSDEEVRHRSIEAFGSFEPTEAILSRVREGMNDEDEIVRTMSIELLGDWEDVDSIEKLYLALDDEIEIGDDEEGKQRRARLRQGKRMKLANRRLMHDD